ncbi:hypothetical protein AGMMS50225_28160 [Betaproteobacteria bacterium]|nr:hypothetical protein AGMMS50225_28160 [Betaproteobacteria bacterium]
MSDTPPAERLIESWADYHAAVLEVLERATHTFFLFDHDFSETGLESIQGAEVLVALARRTSQAVAIRLLVRDATYIERNCARLMHVLTDFAPRIAIKVLTPEQNAPDTAFVIADDKNLALRFHFERPRGRVNLDNGVIAAEPFDQFKILWASAANGPAARALGL